MEWFWHLESHEGHNFFFYLIEKEEIFLGKKFWCYDQWFFFLIFIFMTWLFHYDQWLCKHRYMHTAFCSLYGVFYCSSFSESNPWYRWFFGESEVNHKSKGLFKVILFLFSSFLSTNVTLENCNPFSFPSQIVEFRPLDLPSNIVWIWKRSDLLTTRSRYILLMSSLSCTILL